MKLYFYTNKNVLFDFLERSTIAPNSVIQDKKGYRTISTSSDDFLFVTHKKLSRKSREQGIAEPEFVCPITLEVSAPLPDDGDAILVMNGETAPKYLKGKISNYDTDSCIGAYLIGEIPFSRIEKIYFDTQEDMDSFTRPSPDYWYPTSKYALLPEDFTEELTLNSDVVPSAESIGVDTATVIAGIKRREKERAGLLNFVDGTKRWQHGKYLFNMDESLRHLFDLKTEDVTAALPHYPGEKVSDNAESIDLVFKADRLTEDINQNIYDIVYDAFLQEECNSRKSPEQMTEILDYICEKIIPLCKAPQEKNFIRSRIVEVEKLISDSTDKDPETIMSGFQPADVLRALMLVVKNPNNYMDFMTSLDAYHADLITRRRAMILWGVLNGLYGVPGEGFNKENLKLWQFIEAHVYLQDHKEGISLSVTAPAPVINKRNVYGIELHENRIITADEVRAVIMQTPREKLNNAFYSRLFEVAAEDCGSKKKAENRGYAHPVASVGLPEIKSGSELDSKTRKILEQLLKDCKNPVPAKDKLYKDYIENEKSFLNVFRKDPEYWKRFFRIPAEKTNA